MKNKANLKTEDGKRKAEDSRNNEKQSQSKGLSGFAFSSAETSGRKSENRKNI